MEIINPASQGSQPVPNSNTVLVLGILSLVLSCFLVGLILAIVGLVMAKDAERTYAQNPSVYYGYSSLSTGRVLCIVGLVVSLLPLIYVFIWLIIGGAFLGFLGGFL